MWNIWCVVHSLLLIHWGDAWQNACQTSIHASRPFTKTKHNKFVIEWKKKGTNEMKKESKKTTATEWISPLFSFSKESYTLADEHFAQCVRAWCSLFLFISVCLCLYGLSLSSESDSNQTESNLFVTQTHRIFSLSVSLSLYISKREIENILKWIPSHTFIMFCYFIIQFQEKQCNQTHSVSIFLCRCLFSPSLVEIFIYFSLTVSDIYPIVSVCVLVYKYFISQGFGSFFFLPQVKKISFITKRCQPSIYILYLIRLFFYISVWKVSNKWCLLVKIF